jgi:hypothetical protein
LKGTNHAENTIGESAKTNVHCCTGWGTDKRSARRLGRGRQQQTNTHPLFERARTRREKLGEDNWSQILSKRRFGSGYPKVTKVPTGKAANLFKDAFIQAASLRMSFFRIDFLWKEQIMANQKFPMPSNSVQAAAISAASDIVLARKNPTELTAKEQADQIAAMAVFILESFETAKPTHFKKP